MPKRHPDEMQGRDLAPLCIAGNLREAGRIESALDTGGIEYTFEITQYLAGSGFFGGPRDGVMFLVPAEQHEHCRTLIERAGLSKSLVEK
jgi:hypothetical protein